MKKLIRQVLCPLLLFISGNVFSQSNTITGVVIGDDDNEPLKNVTVSIKGTKTGTKTNEAGYYSIVAEKGQVIMFSFVDYARQEVAVGGSDAKVNKAIGRGSGYSLWY
jgi:CarboxypepD_reg-like domain